MLLRSRSLWISLALMANVSFALSETTNVTATEMTQLMLDAQHALSQVEFPGKLIVHRISAREVSSSVTEYIVSGILQNGCVLGPKFELKLTREFINTWPGRQSIRAEFTSLMD